MTEKYQDVVINSRIQPIFEGTPADVRYYLSTTDQDRSRLRVRAGKMQKIVTAEQYLTAKVQAKTRRDRFKELMEELVKETELVIKHHEYSSEKLEALPEEYTKRIMKILTTPGIQDSEEDRKAKE